MKGRLDFPRDKGLNIRIAVYVPGTQGMTKRITPSEHSKRANQVAKYMRDLFGGTTRIKGEGNWKDKETKKTATERVVIVEAFTTTAEWNRYDKKLKQYLINKKREWKQESLSYEWEDVSRNVSFEGMHFL